jgi:uncharacterized protein (TIGR01777 family)
VRVAVTGSSGLIGSALVDALRGDKIDVLRVVRRPAADSGEVQWDPTTGTIAGNAFDGVDAVVHLAGEGVAERRWTPVQKQKVLDSRVVGTTAIATACAAATNGPSVLVSGSAIGFYGDTGDTATTESGPSGTDFLADLCRQWEGATAPAEASGVRVVHCRTGIVQSRRGGQLGRQLLLFKLGLGGRLGNGRQWVSWISLEDEVRAIRFAIDTAAMRGPMNVTAPEPVTNRDYTKALARVVHRPAILPVPPFALRAILGRELVDSITASQRIVPQALLDTGFEFAHPTIDEGLAWAVQA